jgi:large conductance mechanosensitive channel
MDENMGLISEFKEFAMKGSVVDLAVGVVIGGAFGNIVSSLVKDVMMPPLGLLTGGIDFADKKIVLKDAVLDSAGKITTPATTLNYGNFINNVITFLIIAFSIFIVIKLMNAAKRSPAPESNTKDCPRCLSNIPLKATRCPNCTSDLPATA